MQTFLFMVGYMLVFGAIGTFMQRKEDYQRDLEDAQYKKKTTLFYGLSPEYDNERIEGIKKVGYGTRMERFKFAAPLWCMAIIGGLLLLFCWVTRESGTEPLYPQWLMLFGVLFGLYYHFSRIIQKLERHIGWLEQMLGGVGRDALEMRKASIEEYHQIQAQFFKT